MIYEILAGGPGSGCRGSNCGRPRGAGGTRYTARQRQQLIQKYSVPLRTQIPGLTKQGVIEKEPIAKRAIRQQVTTPEGIQYTLIKSPRARGIQNNPSTVSRYKGLFTQESQVPGYGNTRYVTILQATQPGNPNGPGQALIVHRDYGKKQVWIQEFTHEGDREVYRQRDYTVKNFGQAARFLNNKYGVKLGLPPVGWDKRK